MVARRRGGRYLVLAAGFAVIAAFGVGTLAQARSPGQSSHPVRIGDRLVQPPDMEYFDRFMERGPDGRMRLDGKKALLPKAGADGQPYRNPDGSIKLFPLDDGVRPPMTPGQPR